MATHFAVETVVARPGHYEDFYRVSDFIYSNRKFARRYLKTLTRIIDDVPEVRQKFGPPENLYINEEPFIRGDEDPAGFFAPLIG